MRACTMRRKKTMSKYGVHSNSESLFYYICTNAAKFDLQPGDGGERERETFI